MVKLRRYHKRQAKAPPPDPTFSVVEKLTSLRLEDREAAWVCLYNLSEIPSNLLPTLVQRLSDAEPRVVEIALNAVTATANTHSVELLELGILNIVDSLLTKFLPGSNFALNAKELSHNTAIVANTYYLLSALCEVAPQVIAHVHSRINIWSLLQEVKSFPEIFTAVCHLLQVVTEDSETSFEQYSTMIEGITRECVDVECRSLLTCVLYNITEDTQIVCRSIIPVIQEVLNASLEGQETAQTVKLAYAQLHITELLANILTNDLIMPSLPRLSMDPVFRLVHLLSNRDTYGDEVFPELMFTCLSCLQNWLLLEEIAAPEVLWDILIKWLDWGQGTVTTVSLMALVVKRYGPAISTSRGSQMPVAERLCLLWGTAEQESKPHILAVLSVLGLEQHTVQQNQFICAVILESVQSNNLDIVVEALNCLFDVYSENYYDSNLSTAGLLPICQAQLTRIQQLVEETEELELLERADEAIENLVEFIKYKNQFG